MTERRALQIVVALACLVPIYAGGAGIVAAGNFIVGDNPMSRDLDSHFRYLSGLLFAIGLILLTCIPRIEDCTERFRTLGILVIIGGLARLYAASLNGWPSGGHVFGLVMELAVVPFLILWQGNFAWRHARAISRAAIAPATLQPPQGLPPSSQ